MSALHVFLFGSFRVESVSSHRMFNRPRAPAALLAYLLMHPGAHPRDELTAALWPDRSPDRARHCLNTALWRLRQALEPDDDSRGAHLTTGPGGEVSAELGPAGWIDTVAFEDRTRRLLAVPPHAVSDEQIQDWNAALGLYTGDLLVGFDEPWVEWERDRLRQHRTDALIGLMRAHQARHEEAEALALGHDVVRQDGLREDVHQALMAMYLERGQWAMAERQYEVCRSTLETELQVDPMPLTEELHRRVRATLPAPRSGARPATAGQPPIGGVDAAALLTSIDRAVTALLDCAESIRGSMSDVRAGER